MIIKNRSIHKVTILKGSILEFAVRNKVLYINLTLDEWVRVVTKENFPEFFLKGGYPKADYPQFLKISKDTSVFSKTDVYGINGAFLLGIASELRFKLMPICSYSLYK